MADEFTLDEVVTKDPKDLTDNEKAFLQEQKDNLSDDQVDKFNLGDQEESEEGGEDDQPVDPDDFEVETVERSEDEDEIEGVDEEDAKTISKVVDKKVGRVQQELEETRVESRINAFVADNPDFKKYKEVIKKYKNTPGSVYKNVPVRKVARIVAFEDAQKLGAKKERKARKKAKSSEGGGGGARDQETGDVDWLGMSTEEYKKKKAEVLGRR